MPFIHVHLGCFTPYRAMANRSDDEFDAPSILLSVAAARDQDGLVIWLPELQYGLAFF
jgi:hypothetical protein